MLLALTTAVCASAAVPPPVDAYVGRWSSADADSLPSSITAGNFPNAPLLGNGDLGVALGYDAPSGAIVLHLGLNQMWGIKTYNRQADPSFTGDTAFPRRLGLGSFSVGSALLANGSFAATQTLATGEVGATLSAGGTALSLRAVVSPTENVLLLELNVSGLTGALNVTSSVLGVGAVVNPGHGFGPEKLDGTVGAGMRTNTMWSQRQPLGLSSPKPISVAVATAAVGAAGVPWGGWQCGAGISSVSCALHAPSAAAAAGGAHSLSFVSAVVSNWDLCATAKGCADPLPVAIARAANLGAARAAVTAIAAANRVFWARFWSSSWVALPGDPLLEQFYYGTSYMIGAARYIRIYAVIPRVIPALTPAEILLYSREGSVAAGLWGPWVHCDSPHWQGDFTLVRLVLLVLLVLVMVVVLLVLVVLVELLVLLVLLALVMLLVLPRLTT